MFVSEEGSFTVGIEFQIFKQNMQYTWMVRGPNVHSFNGFFITFLKKFLGKGKEFRKREMVEKRY